MAKYAETKADVEGVFASEDWTNNNITAYPSNYQAGDYSSEFVRLEILPNSQRVSYGDIGVAGNVIVQIFVEAGVGITRATEISDILDTVLQNKIFSRGTQTGASTLAFLGLDASNNSLFRAEYLVPFRKYS